MRPPNENAPAAGNGRGASQNYNPAGLHEYSTSPVNVLLDRLENVRQSGNGWRANCPAHDDKRSALVINQTDDGRLLILCYAGCSAPEIVHSVGLELKDLFPVRITKSMGPEQHREVQQEIKLAGWAAAGVSLR